MMRTLSVLLILGSAGLGQTITSLPPEQAIGFFKDVVSSQSPAADVRAYGARGDGATDDTKAIQDAIDAVRALGRTGDARVPVYFPAGRYLVSKINLYRGIRLEGAGAHLSYIKVAAGSTGNIIDDDTGGDGGVGIWLEKLTIDGNGNDCNLVYLGASKYPFGSYSGIRDCKITNCKGWGLCLENSNASFYSGLEITGCKAGCIDLGGAGGANMFTQLTLSTSGPTAFSINGSGNMISQVHIEGAFTAGIAIGESDHGNVITGVHHYMAGAGYGCVVSIGSHSSGNVLTGIGHTGSVTPTNGVIFDQSYSLGGRKLPGESGYVSYYETTLAQDTSYSSSPPTAGTYYLGDYKPYASGSGGFGRPAWLKCLVGGAPGTWAGVGTAPGAVARTADHHVSVNDNGCRFSNAGAAGPVTFTLPVDAQQLEFEFVKVVNKPFVIDPNDGTDKFQGMAAGEALTLANVGDIVRVGRLTANTWYVMRGNVSTRPPTVDDGVLATKTVVRTIHLDHTNSTDDYQFDDNAANQAKQVITLTDILPAYAEMVNWQIRCLQGVANSNTFKVEFGTSRGGDELGTGNTDRTNEISGPAGAGPALAAANSARSLYFSGTPNADWNLMKATGRWALMITYVDYDAACPAKGQ